MPRFISLTQQDGGSLQSPYGGKVNGRLDLTVRAPSPAGGGMCIVLHKVACSVIA